MQRVPYGQSGFVLVLLAVLIGARAMSGSANGFDLSGSLIPVDEIHLGGPVRDGIPAIDHPSFATAAQADFPGDGDDVLGLALGGETRAYPIGIMNWRSPDSGLPGMPFIRRRRCSRRSHKAASSKRLLLVAARPERCPPDAWRLPAQARMAGNGRPCLITPAVFPWFTWLHGSCYILEPS